jgi:predicted aldo/keto reductase-like oxidoreductase
MDGDRIDRDQAIPMLHRAFEGGVNYVDTAVGYCKQDSQRALGDALKGWRDRIVVSTKNPYYGEDEKEWWQNLEDSLERLQVDYIDVYNTHGVNRKRLEEDVKPRVGKWLAKAKDQGLIRHICTSYHDNNEALRMVVDSGIYESITLQYNMLDRQLEDGIAHAHEKGIGIVVMGPVAGGRLGAPNEQLARIVPAIERIPELALRFVLANPNVTVALSGMSTMQQVEENLVVASDEKALDDEEMAIIADQLDRLKAMADTYCTGCDYCQPCPEGVNVPRIFKLYNDARVYGLTDYARKQYESWKGRLPDGGMQADACIECGECEEKCPQNIPIRAQLPEAHEYLAGQD